MPSHPERVRTASLPEGYQFGDASRAAVRHDALEDAWYADIPQVYFPPWRAPHLNAAEQIEQAYNRNRAERLTRQFDRENAAQLKEWKARFHTIGSTPFTTDRDLGDER